MGENRAHLRHADRIEFAVRQAQARAGRLDECGFDLLAWSAR